MNNITVRLIKLTICPCGAPVLKDKIPLGTEYTLDLDTLREGFYYRCGTCGRSQYNVTCAFTNSVLRPEAPKAPLPAEMFGLCVPKETSVL